MTSITAARPVDSLALSAANARMSSSSAPTELKAFEFTGAIAPRTPSAQELAQAVDKASARLDQGDRAGAYLELYSVTGNEQLLMQAQITTYSGAIGGMALEGNFRAKMAKPEQYTLTLDQFSHEIDKAVIGLARNAADEGRPEHFNTYQIMHTDRAVWASKGMGNHFPGNAQFIGIPGDEHIAKSEGSQNAILAQDEAELGRRPSEYANDPRYDIKTSRDGRFVTVVNNETQRIEVLFDKAFDSDHGSALDRLHSPDLEQIKDEPPTDRIVAERERKMNFVQAGLMVPVDELPAFNPSLARPAANLDRVFEFEGEYYQVDDRVLFEQAGVDFEKMTEDNFPAALKYAWELSSIGRDVDALVSGKRPDSPDAFRETFDQLVETKAVVKLIDSKVAAHLAKDKPEMEYHPINDAHRQLRFDLFTELKAQATESA
ncbi:hypothetical protein [Allohahella marinimesophila]